MSGNWKRKLQDVIDVHNPFHALRNKPVSLATQDQRAKGLFLIFTLLRSMGFLIDDPAALAGRHIVALMKYFTADPSLPAEVAARHGTLQPRKKPYSPAYIQQRLSFLRVFAVWIGKPGLVLPATAYVKDKSLVTRKGHAQTDRSWSAAGVDFEQMVAKVALRDPLVAIQLELLHAFGLRRKEAVMFSPAGNEVPADALPASVPPGRYLWFIRTIRGTKGGRVRYVAVRTDYQRQVLARAYALAPRPGMHVGRPDWPLKKALDHFSYVMRSLGLTKRVLGVTAHGLRHEFAGDLYFELADVPAPVRGGGVIAPAKMQHAYLEVARQLGHGRPRISGAYLGSAAAAQQGQGLSGTNVQRADKL